MALDRKTKDAVTKAVLEHVHSGMSKLLKLELGFLLDQQQRAYGTRGYLFGFRAYTDKYAGYAITDLPMDDRPTVVLPQALHGEHYAWVENQQRHLTDFHRICQGITSILLRVDSPQELRDILPDHALGPGLQHPSINSLQRQDDPLYTAPPEQWWESCWGEKPMQLYASIGPLLETYLGYTLL